MGIGKYKGGLKSGIQRLGLNHRDDLAIEYTEVEKAIASYIELLMKNMAKKAKDKGLDEGSPMIQSINALPIESEKTTYAISLTYDKSGEWFDTGRKAGKRPPLKPIINWIKFNPSVYKLAKDKVSKSNSKTSKPDTKLIRHKKSALKKQKPTLNKISLEKAVKGLAFGIATNIGKEGTIKRFNHKGSHWLTETFGNDNSIIIEELSQVVSKVLGKDVEVWVTKEANKALNGGNNK